VSTNSIAEMMETKPRLWQICKKLAEKELVHYIKYQEFHWPSKAN
jgi:Mn-dependent DtxR family transcriptional regulator